MDFGNDEEIKEKEPEVKTKLRSEKILSNYKKNMVLIDKKREEQKKISEEIEKLIKLQKERTVEIIVDIFSYMNLDEVIKNSETLEEIREIMREQL